MVLPYCCAKTLQVSGYCILALQNSTRFLLYKMQDIFTWLIELWWFREHIMCTLDMIGVHPYFPWEFFCHDHLSTSYSQSFYWIRISRRPSPHWNILSYECTHTPHSSTKGCLIVDPSSRTSAQHYSNIGSITRVRTLISSRNSADFNWRTLPYSKGQVQTNVCLT